MQRYVAIVDKRPQFGMYYVYLVSTYTGSRVEILEITSSLTKARRYAAQYNLAHGNE